MKEPPSILIVDDHAPTADSLVKRLKKAHPAWNFQPAYTLSSALEYLKAAPYDAVITDYRLDEHDPLKTGLVVIDHARAKDKLCVCILMTAYPEDFDRYKEAFNKGVSECIVKSQRGLDMGKEIEFKLQLELQRRWEHEEAYTYARHIDMKLRAAWGATSNRSKLTQRLVAIMFTDVRGFSEATHELRTHPHVIINFLEKLYSVIIEEVHAQNGMVDKFIGDGSLCLFGALGYNDDGNHGKQAAQAALAIQHRWDALESDLKKQTLAAVGVNLPPISLGVGIHIEETMVGIVQTDIGRDQFTALGSGVNLAKKLESFAGKLVAVDGSGKKEKTYRFGNILITGTVQHQVEEDFDLKKEEHELKLLKNKTPYPIWHVRRAKNS